MSFPKKETPEWLKAASNNLPSSNFTVPKSLPGSGPKSNSKNRRKSSIKKEAQSAAFDSKKDKNGLVMHVWDKLVRFEKEDKTFLFNCTWEHISKDIEASEIPEDLVPILNDAKCDFYKGNLFVKFVDYRKPGGSNKGSTTDPEQPQIKTIGLKANQRSIQADLAYLAKHSNETLTSDAVLRLESELLLLYNPKLDLRVDEASITIKLAMQNIESSAVPPKVKCMKNSSEIEAEEAGKKEMKELLLSMNESRPKREFAETIAEVRKKHMQKKAIPTQAPDSKKTKVKRSHLDDVAAGYKRVRLIQFERGGENGKIYTSCSIYQGPSGDYEIVVRFGPGNPSNEANKCNGLKLHSASLVEDYAVKFIAEYSMTNTLVSDSKKPASTEKVSVPPSNPEPIPIEPSSEIPFPISTPQPAAMPKEQTPLPASAAMSPLKDQNPSGLIERMTPQQLADHQMSRNKHLLQQKMQQHLEKASPQNQTPPRPVNQAPTLLPQFGGFQYSVAQLHQIQQMQQHNFQALVNTQQHALRQQSAMMPQDMTPQQQQLIAAQRKQQYDALRSKAGMNLQEMRPSPAQRPQMALMFTPAQRQALDALSNKQVLSPAQNQALDAVLQQPMHANHRQFLLNLRAQAIFATPNPNPTSAPDAQASHQGSAEPSTPNPPKIPTPQQPSTPQQPPQTPQVQVQQQIMQKQPQPSNFTGPTRSATQIQQSFTPQQQQAFATLQQQGLNQQQVAIMGMLQQHPSLTPNQQQLLKSLQNKHAHHSYQIQAFLAQTLKHNKQLFNPQQLAQSNTMSSGAPHPTSQMQASTSHLSPQEQHTIRINQFQQQVINAQLQAQMQAQYQRQAQQYQNMQQPQQRAFIRPNMQQQILARLQQQAILNPMGQLPQQLMPLNMAQAMHPLRPGMPMPIHNNASVMPVNPLQSPLPPGKMQHGSQPPTN